MSDLIINLELLHQLRDDLDAVVKEFANADDFSDDVAIATGHENLGDHVSDFAHKWNDKRKTMTEAVEGLRKKIEGITDGFTQVDDGLAKALTDAAPPLQTATPL
ncbi:MULTISPECIES: hypothetical protein [Cryobacterium]|uniref:Flagellar protein FlgN n=1 Tax=Cryobacterium zongtaii TaxID=1259217 RepID=A0A2S3ZMW6_9MICO|nr:MULTISPECIES: hypothetical protein [Cryobacterium]POH68489.1 hypothetical protein C3B60_04660 [Cryobacterium zongtaii]POH70106.1 hypothetical protein C3B61_00345 [Cryobacterium zongtaii]TFC49176.1 hypothetical protein E3O57_00485 [Cryobacterium sp. TMN-39-2]